MDQVLAAVLPCQQAVVAVMQPGTTCSVSYSHTACAGIVSLSWHTHSTSQQASRLLGCAAVGDTVPGVCAAADLSSAQASTQDVQRSTVQSSTVKYSTVLYSTAKGTRATYSCSTCCHVCRCFLLSLCLCLCTDNGALRLEAWCHRTARVPLLPPTHQQRAPDSDYRQAAFCIRWGMWHGHMRISPTIGAQNTRMFACLSTLSMLNTLVDELSVQTPLHYSTFPSTCISCLYQHTCCRACCCCSLPVSPDLDSPQWMTCHTGQAFADTNAGRVHLAQRQVTVVQASMALV
jgi:hypothetical protein